MRGPARERGGGETGSKEISMDRDATNLGVK
jgi:hypothetical protein